MSDTQEVLAALTAEADAFDEVLAALTNEQWQTPTPAPGWTVAHQVAHLAFTFRLAATAASDPDGFRAMAAGVSKDFDAQVRAGLAMYLGEDHQTLRARWRAEFDDSVKALTAVPAGETVPWLVNPLPPAVLASAGMMELFGHGQDVYDALGIEREYTDRLAPLVTFGVRTRDFGYLAHDEQPPAEQFRFELTAPSGALWTFGPADAEQRVTGPAVDFCLLVVRRRHHEDLALRTTGELARHWLDIAQAYRGPAGAGRRPGQFAAITR